MGLAYNKLAKRVPYKYSLGDIIESIGAMEKAMVGDIVFSVTPTRVVSLKAIIQPSRS